MEIRPEEFRSLTDWIGPALLFFVIAVPVLAAFAFVVCYIYSTIRHGPVEAFYAVSRVIATAVGRDLPQTRLGRTLAIARLTFKEALRRKVLAVFAIFAVIFLFAGWFLDVKSDDPAHLYLSFVLTTTNYLVLVLALFLSTFSLPADIKSKTIHTVVTKPVRPTEIIFGRLLGFATIGTLLLALMCLVSYVFVMRGLAHEHQVDEATIVAADEEENPSARWQGETTVGAYHRHSWTVDSEGNGETDRVMGHVHRVTAKGDLGNANELAVEFGPQTGALMARVPVYGRIYFLDDEGNRAIKGISVGKEWEYRSYVQGRSSQAAVWIFDDLKASDFPDGLPLAMTLSVFRTFKGDIVTGVRGIIYVRNPNPRNPIQCEPIPFIAEEFTTQQITIPRKLRPIGSDGTSGKREIDLFEDLVHEGQVEIVVQCDDRSQYFGMAQADLYIESEDAPFAWNFVKAYIGIWLQMLVVLCLGVMFSTFLSTPVAILATVSTVLLGFVGQFIRGLWTGESYGGGPIESTIRIVTQENMVSPLEIGDIPLRIIQWSDYFLITLIHALASLLPNFSSLGRPAAYVAYNFNVYGDFLARQCITTFIYVLAISIIGYFLLKTREIAA
jgi:ABC-type transport system involved in multi-copper enzyme maturation permease subunit